MGKSDCVERKLNAYQTTQEKMGNTKQFFSNRSGQMCCGTEKWNNKK